MIGSKYLPPHELVEAAQVGGIPVYWKDASSAHNLVFGDGRTMRMGTIDEATSAIWATIKSQALAVA